MLLKGFLYFQTTELEEKQKAHFFSGKVSGTAAGCLLGCLPLISEWLGSNPGSSVHISFLLMHSEAAGVGISPGIPGTHVGGLALFSSWLQPALAHGVTDIWEVNQCL